MTNHFERIAAAGLLWLSVTATGFAGDWPQILGPARNGVAQNEQISIDWPTDGPTVLWTQSVGSGFAGVAIRDATGIVFHRIEDKEIAEAFAASTGKTLWRSVFSASYRPIISDDDGPRVVPLIDRDRVILFGAMGQLRCLELDTGKTIWQRDTFEDYNSKKPYRGEPPEGYFGFGTSPIVIDNKVILNVGGDANDAGIVAFDEETGRTIWKATSDRASYSSPVAATIDGVRHVIFVTRLNVVSLDPTTGLERFRFQFGRPGPTVNGASPVVFGRHLFVTASYGIGSVLASIHGDEVDTLWRNNDVFASQYATCIEHDGFLIGLDGRQDGPAADLKCFNARTQQVSWNQPGFGYATLLSVGKYLLIVKTDGILVAAELNASRYVELKRSRIATSTIRALPALSGGLLYVRDKQTLKCLDLRPH